MGRPKIYDEALRERLLEEAAKTLAKDGYRAVSLRTVTNDAGTSTNAVYTLFGSKEALMAEVILGDLDDNLVVVAEAAELDDPKQALLEVANRLRSLAQSNPNLFTGAFEAMSEAREASSLTGRLNPAVREIDKKLLAPITRVCERIAEQAEREDLDPTKMSIALWSATHGFIVLELGGLLPEYEGGFDDVFEGVVGCLYGCWSKAAG